MFNVPPSSLIENALDMMESRIVRHGRDTRHFLFVSAAYLLMRSSKEPKNEPRIKEYVIARISVVYDKL